MGEIKKIEKWITSDGKEHGYEEWAIEWDEKIEAATKATEMLRSGMPVAYCLRAIDYPADIPDVLEYVTKETQLVISHWQCRDTPGYKPIRFRPDGRIDVWGYAGSWSGPYGGAVKIETLAEYAKDKRTLFEGVQE